MNWDEFFEALIRHAIEKGRSLVSYAISVVGPVLLVVIAHFVGFLTSFGPDIAQVLDIGTVVRFSFSAFLFFGLILSLVRLTVMVTCATFSSRFVDIALMSLSRFATSFRSNGADRIVDEREAGVTIIGYALGFITFSIFYLGSLGAFIFLLSFLLFNFILFGVLAIRQSIIGGRIRRELSGSVIIKFFPLTFVIFSFVAGELRGEYVIKSKNFFVYHSDDFTSCADTIKSRHESDPTNALAGESSGKAVFLEGVVMLVTQSGYVFYQKSEMNTVFIPWEKGYLICLDPVFSMPISISEMPAYFLSLFEK